MGKCSYNSLPGHWNKVGIGLLSDTGHSARGSCTTGSLGWIFGKISSPKTAAQGSGESLSLEGFQSHVGVALGDVV